MNHIKIFKAALAMFATVFMPLIRNVMVPSTVGFAMAQTTAVQRESVISPNLALPVAASTTIYKGSMVCADADGYAVPASDTSGLSNVIGIADETVDNSAGSDGDLSVVVVTGRRWILTASSIGQDDVGATMYVVDDETVDETDPGNGIRAGVLTRYISATSGEVAIGGPLNPTGTVGTSDLGAGAVTPAKLSRTVVYTARVRATIAQVNAGVTIVAAPGASLKLRLIECKVIAIGGNVGGGDGVDVKGTASASVVNLARFATGDLTQSAVLGVADATVLADGASFVALDANTAITAAKNGIDLTTATNVDFIVEYAIDAA